MRRRPLRRSGAKSALEFAPLGAPRGAQKSVVSPVPSTSSSWFQLDHHSRMSVFSDKRKKILPENARIQEGCCPVEFQSRNSEAQTGRSPHASPLSRHKIGLPCCMRSESSFSDRELDSAFLIGRIGLSRYWCQQDSVSIRML